MNREKRSFTDDQMLRREAEDHLKKNQKNLSKGILETDAKKLLHELQVHQIELEMQNEELRLAYETTEKALKNYTMLYDFAPMGYFTLEPDGTIGELNFTAAEILGDKRFSLIGSNLKLFVSEESRLVFDKFLNKVFLSKVKESCKIILGFDKKPPCNVYMEGVVTGDDEKCLLSVIDITGLKK